MTIFLKKTSYGDNIIYKDTTFMYKLKNCIYNETGIFTKNVIGENEDEFYLCPDNDCKDNTEMKKVKKYLKEVFNINSKNASKQLITFSYNLKWAKPISFKLSTQQIDNCKALLKLKGY